MLQRCSVSFSMDNSDLTLSSTSPDRVVIHLVVGNNKWL